MSKIPFRRHFYLALRSRSKSGSRSTFWHAAVDIRGSALPSAIKSKEESLSVEGVCLCVE